MPGAWNSTSIFKPSPHHGPARRLGATATFLAALLVAVTAPGCLAVVAGGAAAGTGAAAGAASTDPDRNAADVIADASITAAVKTALAGARRVRAHNINVDTRNGEVTLNGIVHNEEERAKAIRITSRVRGVRRVIDKMRLRT